MNEYVVDNFLAFTIGILVFFVGVHINTRVGFLRKYNIPEPVTGGLILASLIGGPIAHILISRFQLKAEPGEQAIMGVSYEQEETANINHMNLMAVFLTLHITIIIGWIMNEAIAEAGLKLPLFVACLLTGIILTNIIPLVMPKVHWPSGTRALAVVSDFSLGLFLAMSLMSMQLWTIAGLAGSLMVILLLQTLAALAFIFFILFPLMGRNYQAAVLSAGFGGFALGATPTAIANMTTVTKSHGPAPLAFIILPLVAAFFVDIANSFVIKFALSI